MTEAMMNLPAPEKTPDADLLREMIGFAAERLMELEVARPDRRRLWRENPLRLAQRNGYRDRDWETRAGTGRAAHPQRPRAPNGAPSPTRSGRKFPSSPRSWTTPRTTCSPT